jgi:hypothetical protein
MFILLNSRVRLFHCFFLSCDSFANLVDEEEEEVAELDVDVTPSPREKRPTRSRRYARHLLHSLDFSPPFFFLLLLAFFLFLFSSFLFHLFHLIYFLNLLRLFHS